LPTGRDASTYFVELRKLLGLIAAYHYLTCFFAVLLSPVLDQSDQLFNFLCALLALSNNTATSEIFL